MIRVAVLASLLVTLLLALRYVIAAKPRETGSSRTRPASASSTGQATTGSSVACQDSVRSSSATSEGQNPGTCRSCGSDRFEGER